MCLSRPALIYLVISMKNFSNTFYAPNLEEVEGAYWFWPVRLSVTLVDYKTRELLELGT